MPTLGMDDELMGVSAKSAAIQTKSGVQLHGKRSPFKIHMIDKLNMR